MTNNLDDIVKGYQEKITQGYQPKDYSKQYEAIGNNLKSAYDSQFNAQKEQLNAQAEQLVNDYRQQRSGAFVTAKKNAQANNETLAAQGLARDAYGRVSSGTAEKIRTEQDAALMKNINALNVGQQKGITEIQKSIADAEHQKNLDLAEALSQLDQERLTTQQQEDQFGRNYDLSAYEALVSQQATQAEQALAQKELEEKIRQNEIANQLERDRFTEQQRQNAAGNTLANAQFTEQQKQNALANELARLEFEELQKQNAAGNSLASAQLAEQMKQNAYNNALAEIALYGYVKTDAAAAALGLAKGTKLTKNQLKALGVSV